MSAPASRADWAARGHAFAASATTPLGRDESRLRAFANAHRHSRIVRLLRVWTPVGVAGVLAVGLLAALFNPFRGKADGVSVGEFSVNGTQIVMGRPKLTGFRRDGRAYVVTAVKAIQDVKRPTFVELRGIDGDLGMADQNSLHVDATVGFYDTVHQTLRLSKDVRIHNASYDVKLASADIDFKGGVYSSDEPVTLVMTNGGTIAADSAVARDNGEELTFSGHVRSRFAAEPDGAATAGQLKGTNP